MPESSIRRTGVLLAVGLLVAAIGFVGSAAPSQARPATGGSGRFGTNINWVEWGTAGQNLPNSGFTGSSTQMIEGVQVTITCTASGLTSTQSNQATPFLKAYRSGDWKGDVLDDLYNIGGTGTSNQLVYGLANATGGSKIAFDVTCAATSDGRTVPLAGLVFGDAEQSGATEYVGATPLDPGTWRIIDRFRTAGCTHSSLAKRDGATNRLTLESDTTDFIPCPTGPSAVAFLEGSTRMRAELQGWGSSAIAIGVVLSTDYGDAPASYGDAAHVASFTFAGGEVPAGTPTRISEDAFLLASAAAPLYRLGDYTDPEVSPYYSADATGDDVNGSSAFPPADDENGLLSSSAITGVVGGQYQTTVNCYPAGAPLAGWIDWNIDGDYTDADERSADATCAGGATTLTWAAIPDTVIGKLRGASTFLRLRLAAAAVGVANPTGSALSGEAEDYRLTLSLVPAVTVTKVVSGRVAPSDQFTVQILDGASTIASSTTTGTNTSTSTGPSLVSSGVAYTISESLAAGTSTLADYDTSVTCTNTVTGQPVTPTGTAPSWTLPALTDLDAISCTITNLAHAPALALTKSASPVIDRDGNGPDAGDLVNYSFGVTNTGNVPLSDVTIAEATFSGTQTDLTAITCQAATLEPGMSTTCTASYVLQQSDVDAGRVTNSARAFGTPTGTIPRIGSPIANASVDIDRTAELSLVKSVEPSGTTDFTAGQVLTYSFVVTNTGNVTLDDVAVAETAFSGAGPRPVIDCPAAAPVPPGGQVICSASYTLEQTDIDNATVGNQAEATASGPAGVGAPTPATGATALPADQNPSLALTKTVDPTSVPAAGTPVRWTFALTNTGNVTLTDVHPVEVAFDGSDPLGAIDCPTQGDPLLPGATAYCTADYTVTQDDMDAGTVTNSATGAASDPNAAAVTAPQDDAELTLAGDPAISLVKTVSPTTAAAAGDQVVFSYAIENTGNVTLTNLGVNEYEFTGTGALGVRDCAKLTLAPGEETTCTADYTLTQADVDAGGVTNTAVATASAAHGLGGVNSVQGSAQVTIARTASFSFAKTATPTDPAELTVGEVVHYSFVVTNTGNVTLRDIAVADTDFSGRGAAPVVSCPDSVPLAPQQQLKCTGSYTIVQDDVDQGRVSNTALAGAGGPAGMAAPAPVTDTVDLDLRQTSGLELVKSVAPATASRAGEQVTWLFEVTNTGTLTLRDVRPIEQSFTGTGELGPVVCPVDGDLLAPATSVVCSVTYVVTQADVDAGQVTNMASATAQVNPGGSVQAPAVSAVLATPRASKLGLTKTADPAVVDTVGQPVKFTFVLKNLGNTTLSDLALAEAEFTGTGELGPMVCPDGLPGLAPGESVTCTADYLVTQADLDAGDLRNAATATATAPDGALSASASLRVGVERRPGLSLVKTADRAHLPAVGEGLGYRFEVVNTGNVTLRGVRIVEDEFSGTGVLSPITCPVGFEVLDPGERAVCTAGYVLTQADVDAGQLRNTAVATADSELGPVASVLGTSVLTPSGLPLTGGGTGLAGIGALLALAGAWLIRYRRTSATR